MNPRQPYHHLPNHIVLANERLLGFAGSKFGLPGDQQLCSPPPVATRRVALLA